MWMLKNYTTQFMKDSLSFQKLCPVTRQMLLLITLFIFAITVAQAQQLPDPPQGLFAGQATNVTKSSEPGLLFYLSGNKDFKADFAAGGQNLPNFIRDVKIIPDGAAGSAFEAADKQLMTYWAPGNIYAQRGTLSFFWRSRYPMGTTPFPVFRVAFSDHSSWDMVWLRIDFNGSGFDAFVTDVGLTRTRVSHYMDVLPQPNKWSHIALSWDETEGIRFYIDGKLVEKQTVTGNLYDTGLDQFGPHSRIISPYQVQSEYSFVRGGDLDELRIYDRMLSDENIAQLSRVEIPTAIPDNRRNLNERRWRDEWWTRNGWNLPNNAPPLLTSSNVSVRKVEIHEAYDVKRWIWKANDGIRETTWPGVYNMSRLPGRYDYFVLPDWDIYSHSGQSIKFQLPNEPWNHVEIWGKAWGQLTYEKERAYDTTFGVRRQNQIKSYHQINGAKQGGTLRFDNALIEEPIGELGVYFVHDGKAPQGSASETFTLTPAPIELHNPALEDIAAFVNGRYPADEQSKMVGVGKEYSILSNAVQMTENALPFINIMIPYTSHPNEGLDGVEITLPALSVTPTHNGVFPLNIRVKDPLWQMRDMADFSFSVKPNEPHTLWIDTRDRILPEGRALYITLSGAGAELTSDLLKGAQVRLVYKPKEQAKAEHELDRLTQVRDLYGFTIEEHPVSSRLNLANRLFADDADLLKVNPNNKLGLSYKYATTNDKKDRPVYKVPEHPADVPEWAFLQTEYLRHLANIVNFYIDKRQIGNGEFGGGLSDDDDLTNMFVGTAFMGIEPDKTLKSLRLMMAGFYDQERDPYDANLRQRSLPLFTNGIATITTDQLHAYEEGIEAVGQLQILDYGNPLHINHGMEIAKRLLDDVTQVNPKGHRYFRSRLYGGTHITTDDPWQWTEARSYHMLHTAYNIARYNSNPSLRKLIVDLADGLLAHTDKNNTVFPEVNFSTDMVRGTGGVLNTWQVFMAAYDISSDKKYLSPIPGRIQESQKFDKDSLVRRYSERLWDLDTREYINTEGSVWIDRVVALDNDLQTDRLGGVALWRGNNIYQQNHVSWNIAKPATYSSMAFFIPRANSSNIDIIAYNLESVPVSANMTVWDFKPGRWKIRQGLDTNDDQKIDINSTERIVNMERGEALNLTFAPHKNTIVNLELIEPFKIGYAERPDFGIGNTDVKINDNVITVRVYSLGSVDTPATTLEFKDANGKRITTVPVPALKAPLDLIPKWTDIKVTVPKNTDISSGSVQLDPERKILQITRQNDFVKW